MRVHSQPRGVTDDTKRLLGELLAAADDPARAIALQQIGRAAAVGASMPTLVPAVIDQLDAGDEWTVQDAAAALGALGDVRAVEPLGALLRLPPILPPEGASSNEAYAYATLAFEQDTTVLAAVKALVAIGSDAALPMLRVLAASAGQADRVQEAARSAIASLDGSG